ncbi:uncharacterized protein J3D65DRAFT_667472 [Phyllosticta citribraziliensis]|uniref:Uncharacterized protein n=1 Tax=Phyllosticta citribraziliensis TaxID=989973 RepID=A0ABR1LUF0_9PEZI
MTAFSSILKTIFVPLLVAGILYALATHVLLPLHRRYIRRYQHYLPLHAASTSYDHQHTSSSPSRFSPAALSARAAHLLSALSARLTRPFAPSSHAFTSNPPSYRSARRRAGTRRQAGTAGRGGTLLDSSASSSDDFDYADDDERDADIDIASDEGEGMIGFAPVQTTARREALERLRHENWDGDGHGDDAASRNSDAAAAAAARMPGMGLGRMGTGLGLGGAMMVGVVDEREVERGERRLSRELEEGFRDSSDSDEAPDGRARASGGRVVGGVR